MKHNELYELFRDHNIRNYCRGTYIPRNGILRNHFLPEHGNEEVGSTTSLIINSIYDAMEAEGLMPNTIFGAYAAMSSYFNFAIALGELTENPVSSARSVRPDCRKARHA